MSTPSVLPTRYETDVKNSFGGVIRLLRNLSDNSGRAQEIGKIFHSNLNQNVDLRAHMPYHVYVAMRDDATKRKMAVPTSKEQTTGKRDIEKGIDYWLGGGRFGKRYYDYGLTKTRFGRSLDHVDLNDEEESTNL